MGTKSTKTAEARGLSAEAIHLGGKLDQIAGLLGTLIQNTGAISASAAAPKLAAGIYHHPKLLQAKDGSWYTLQWSETLDGRFTHADAIKACKAVKLGGHSDWRLPERFELESLIDIKRRNPASSAPGMKADWYWSADPLVSASDPSSPSGFAWFVDFLNGFVLWNSQNDYGLVRACRRVPARQS